jgi:endoglucanase
VSSVGTRSKPIAYVNKRADDTFIGGGRVPGFVEVDPDFPESKEDQPFLWFENE